MSKYKVGDTLVALETRPSLLNEGLVAGEFYEVVGVTGPLYKVSNMKGKYAGGWYAYRFNLVPLDLENE
jgi:hypothetical protein